MVWTARTGSACRVLRAFEEKRSMENGCFWVLHQYSKICCKKSEAGDFSYLFELANRFPCKLKNFPTDVSNRYFRTY